jgi:hypothetical protein
MALDLKETFSKIRKREWEKFTKSMEKYTKGSLKITCDMVGE